MRRSVNEAPATGRNRDSAALLWLPSALWGLGRAVLIPPRDLSRADVPHLLCAFYCVIYSVCEQGNDVQEVKGAVGGLELWIL